jgi:hypothetical protein
MTEQTARANDDQQAPAGVASEPQAALALGVRGRQEAAALMWQWRDNGKAADVDRATQLRKKGVLQGAIGLAVAGVFFALGFQIMTIIVASIASITLLTALVSPLGAYAAIEGALAKFALWVGGIVAWIVLMPVFIGFFVPFGLIFRRGPKDPMKRIFVPEAATYWRERQADTDVEGRRRSQF